MQMAEQLYSDETVVRAQVRIGKLL